MSGSSVGAMVVGTVFIMVFGMATVTLVESVDQSVKTAEFELPDPQVTLVSVTDREESTGPVEVLSIQNNGEDYTEGDTCSVSGSSGTGLSFTISVDGSGGVTGLSITASGNGYSEEDLDLDCTTPGGSNGIVTIDDVHDTNTISIRNIGSETVDLSHIFVTYSDTGTNAQGNPFAPFVSHYTGSNLYLFPGEQLSTDAFPLDSNTHGFAIDDDPDRAFLAIYDYNDAETVTIT